MALAASLLLGLVQGVLLLCLGYHYFLAVASIGQPPSPLADKPEACPTTIAASPHTRFAIAIPAHNEASVLSATLAQLHKQEYPRGLFDVHVVADHCTDDTVEVVQRSKDIVHIRNTLPKGRKAYALQWLLERILSQEPPYHAVAIFDADSLVEPGFLSVMDRHLRVGAQALQGQHIVSNPRDSLVAAVAAVDMRLNNRLRNQSRRNLGLACRLMGDAMVLDARVLRAHGWLGESMTEDREYGYELLLRGIRVQYVPEARSFGQAASSWRQAEPQRLRWYGGVIGMQRRLAGRLLAGALRSRQAGGLSYALFDGAIELLMPSYTFLLLLSIVNLGLVAGLKSLAPTVHGLLGVSGSLLLLAAWGLYPVAGLAIDHAPAWAFRALLLGPVYLAWRLWISILVRVRRNQITWIRTPRREELDSRR